ncbi:MAG: glutathione synthase [Myxococcales bacterium]|nr:glutathione synthase [Myxococcales bacterium]
MAFVSVFIMDPVERIDIAGDSTFVLMLECQARGHEVLFAQPKDLEQRGSRVFAHTQAVTMQRVRGDHVAFGAKRTLCLDDADAVFMRKDPPFDEHYLVSTWILDRVDQRHTVMVNDPQGIRDFNEKLAALRWPEFMPPTMISADRAQVRAFIAEHGEVVVKPLLNAGGTGIIMLKHGDRNIGSVLDLLTREGRSMIEAQRYIPDVTQGDKRIILLNGEPLGAVNRVPAADDIRANMHVGGRAEAIGLSERDKEICRGVGPELARRGLVFTGIDVIGGFLTEVNVTSPTGLQEINRFDGVTLEAKIIDWVEARRAELG